jgi:hypothetical protein
MIVLQQSTEPFFAAESAMRSLRSISRWEKDNVPFPLMRTLGMIMFAEIRQDAT